MMQSYIALLFPYTLSGWIASITNWLNEAHMHFSETISMNSRHIWAYAERGRINQRKGRYTEALKDFAVCLQLDPNNSEVHLRRGEIAYMSSDFSQAIVSYNESIRLTPRKADAYRNRGIAKAHQKDFTGAISDLSSAIQIESDAVKLYEHYKDRAKIKANNLSDYLGALTDYNLAIDLKDSNHNDYWERAKVKSKLGDKSGAAEDQKKAMDMDDRFII